METPIILIKKLFDNNLNIPEGDGLPCKKCHIVPEVNIIRTIICNGLPQVYKDRSSRIDCDASKGRQRAKIEVWHKRCYIQEILSYD